MDGSPEGLILGAGARAHALMVVLAQSPFTSLIEVANAINRPRRRSVLTSSRLISSAFPPQTDNRAFMRFSMNGLGLRSCAEEFGKLSVSLCFGLLRKQRYPDGLR